MNHFLPPLKTALQKRKNDFLYRKRFSIEARDETHCTIEGKKVIHFCGNNYLALTNHPAVKEAYIKGIQDYGVGSGASSLISGYMKPHYCLEEAMSEFLGREKSILFNSGYHANLGVMTALPKKNSAIIADKLCHASLIDGILLSRAKYCRFEHNNTEQAEYYLKKHSEGALLVTESVFSMQGNIANIKQLVSLAKRYQSFFIVDDAHGIGVLGKYGKGIIEAFHLTEDDVPCLITPLGKAFGSLGAIVSGSSALIDTLIQCARSYCYTTSLPPAVSVATLAALYIIKNETWRRERLHHLSRFFIAAAKERQCKLYSEDVTPIQYIIIGSNKLTFAIQNDLLEKGFFVSCIRPPTVKKELTGIRISLNCLHHESDIIQLLDTLFLSHKRLQHDEL